MAGAVLLWAILLTATLVPGFVFFEDSALEVLEERQVDIELGDFSISPETIEVGPQTRLSFNVTNVDDTQHDLTISSSVTTGRLKPGEAAVIEGGVVRKSFTIWCSIKGHREQGMEGRVELVELG